MDKKILVVDDETAILKMLSKAFELAGYSPVTASSGEEALRILKREEIHVMFLDLRLPGMNGVELCMRIKRDRPIAIIYAMTGYSNVFELFDCREAGFDDYFLKPLDLETIISIAHQSFEKIDRWKKQKQMFSPDRDARSA